MDERIIALANELIGEVIKSGRETSLAYRDGIIWPAHFIVTVMDNYNPPKVVVENITHHWQIEGTYIPAQPEKGE